MGGHPQRNTQTSIAPQIAEEFLGSWLSDLNSNLHPTIVNFRLNLESAE